MNSEPNAGSGSPLLPVAAQIREAIAADQRRPVLLLIGGIGSGKTATGLRLVSLLRSHGIRPGGILAPRILEREETVGYSIIDLSTNTTHPFAGLHPSDISIGKYYVSNEGQQLAERILLRAAERHPVVFVDEIGRLELTGSGHTAAVRRLLASQALVVLMVRDSLAQAVLEAFSIDDPWILHVSELREGEELKPGGSQTFWDIVDAMPYPLLITQGVNGGYPQARPMHLVDHDRRAMWFATSRASRKVQEILANGRVTVLFVDSARYNYAALHGQACVVEDRARQETLWRNEWEESWPRGPSDPDYVLIRVDGSHGHFLRGFTGESGQIELG